MTEDQQPVVGCRQATITGAFASLATVVLIALSVLHIYFYVVSAADPLTLVVAAVLVSQAISCSLLILPILRDANPVSIQTCRAGCVALSLTGLGLVVGGSSVLLVASGALVLSLSCVSLMAAFWPASPDDFNEELTPFLANGDPEEGGNDYQLLEEEENTIEDDPAQEEDTTPPTVTSSRIRGTRRLLQLAAPQVLYLYAGCAVLLIRLPFSLSIPHFVSSALSATARADFEQARHEVVWLFLAGCIDAALDFWCIFLFGYANQRIVRGVRLDLFAKLIRQEVAFFDQTSSGELASRLNSDCSEMAGDLTWFFRFSIESVVRITGITAYMLIRSPILGTCALSIVPLVAVINKIYGDWLRHNAIQVQDALAEANVVSQEALSNARTVIAFAAEQRECRRYEKKIDRQYQLNIRQLFMTGVYYMTVSTFLINTVVQATLLWIGASLIEHHKLSAEVLLAFMLYQGQLQNETLNLFQSYSSLIKSSGAGDKVFALLDRAPPAPAIFSSNVRAEDALQEEDDDDDEPRQQQYDVELKGVTFRYPSRPDHPVLDNLNLLIPKGKTIALVGSSGCGKTTIVNLLQRFYDPVAGSILVDGRDLRNLDLWQHRRHLGVVTQEPALFCGTLLENITYGVQEGSPTPLEEVIRVASLANADGFIREFPDGYNTAVGERGVQVRSVDFAM
jgi:ABC-type multidrug transport system fused ATPase/permease subunit